MNLAVGLLTADRPKLTQKTLESFTAFGPRFVKKYHADDGSVNRKNHNLADHHGFKTVYTTGQRLGQIPAIRAMIANAYANGATHFLYLENDWQFTRTFPSGVIEILASAYETVRLYRAYKRSIEPLQKTGEHIIGTKEKIKWCHLEHPYGWEAAPQAHWGGPPSVTEIGILHSAVVRSKTIGELNRNLARISTARPVKNIVEHIGLKRTPGFTL